MSYVLLRLSRWNVGEKLLELVAWLVLLPRAGQQLANSFLVALLRMGSQLGERLTGLSIGGSDLQGGVGHSFPHCHRVESADKTC